MPLLLFSLVWQDLLELCDQTALIHSDMKKTDHIKETNFFNCKYYIADKDVIIIVLQTIYSFKMLY